MKTFQEFYIYEELLDVATTYKKLAVKHLKDMHSKDATEANKRYAQTMNKRALEASKMSNHTDALNHYRGVKEETELDEAVDPSEVASNPKMYNSDTVKKAYYHKNASESDKKSLERHLDRHHGNKEWRKKPPDRWTGHIATITKHMSAAEKKDKGWSNPNVKEETEMGDAAHATTMKHRVLVTYSDPNHTASHMRKEKVQKHLLVPSSHKGESVYKAEAEELAKKHMKKQGYRVHEVEHVGLVTKKVNEEIEQLDEISSETLQRYKDKAKESAEKLTAAGMHKKATDRWMGHMKATGKQIEKTTAAIRKALNR